MNKDDLLVGIETIANKLKALEMHVNDELESIDYVSEKVSQINQSEYQLTRESYNSHYVTSTVLRDIINDLYTEIAQIKKA